MSAPLLRLVVLSVLLATTSVPVTASSWVQSAQDGLAAELARQYPEVAEWSLMPLLGKRQPDSAASAGDVAVVTSRLGRRSAVRVSWSKPARRETLWFAVSGELPALSVTQDVRALGPVSAAMTRLDSSASWSPDCRALLELSETSSLRARRPLRRGQVLCAESVEVKPPVSRGEQITVISVAGMVSLETTGIAESDGALGQAVWVKNPSNGERYEARVSGEGEVRVQ